MDDQKQLELNEFRGMKKGNAGGGRRRDENNEYDRNDRRTEGSEDWDRDRNRQGNRARDGAYEGGKELRSNDRDDSRLPRLDDRSRDNNAELRLKDRRRDDYVREERDRGPRQNHKDPDYVSKAEYDELSALCSRLMDQQDELKDEIERQAQLIKVIFLLSYFFKIMFKR